MRVLFFLLLTLSADSLWAQKNKLVVTPVAPGFWVHTTYGEFKGTYFPANGLIVDDGRSILIVDTGWGEKASRKLLRWVKKNLHKPVSMVMITHAHDDRAGGIAVFQQRKIPIWLPEQTAEILKKEKGDLTGCELLSGKEGEFSRGLCHWFFPGAGHAPDNIVIYFSRADLLFGGCFVKSREAGDLGNLKDANLATWPGALRQVQQRFPDTRIVIPGHQAWGGPELLEHTLKLLETNSK